MRLRALVSTDFGFSVSLKYWSNGCGVVKEILRIWSGENAIRFRKQKSSIITATKIEKIWVFQSQIWVMLNFKERNQESRPSITTSLKMIGRAIKPLYKDDLGCVLHQPSKHFLHCYIFWANSQSVFSQNQENMSQSGLISKEGSEKKMVSQPQRLKISMPHFDNSALIQGYSKTLIGRCMNPRLQDMKALIYMLPRIWKMEERVAGADLGLGRFQLDFDNEEDIVEVLKAEPFHFDHWMISLVRWEPVMAPNYPWDICFWMRVMGVPLQFWADPTFRSIGDGIGETKEIDLDGGRVRVIINGFKPLVFETIAEFYNGEEVLISLRYEKLFGYCRICFSLCHDQEMCPERVESKGLRSTRRDDNAKDLKEVEHEQDKSHKSYKGAVSIGRFGSLKVKEGSERVPERHDKGKGKMYEERHFSRPNNTRTAHRRDERKHGGGSSSFRSFYRYAPSNRYMMDTKGLEVLRNANFRHGLTDNERLMLESFHGKGSSKAGSSNASKPNDGDANGGHEMEAKKVRKELRFEVESQVTGISMAVDMEDTEVSVASLVLEDNLDSNEVMQKEEDPILKEMENERDDTLLDVVEKDSRVTDVSVDGKDIREEEHVHRELIGTDKEDKEKKQGVKKKTLNASSIFVGRTAKKMVQALISPHKKVLAKNIGRPGKNTGLEVAKSTSNSGTGIDSIHSPDT